MSALSQSGAAVSSTHLKDQDCLAFRAFCDMDTIGQAWAGISSPGMGSSNHTELQ